MRIQNEKPFFIRFLSVLTNLLVALPILAVSVFATRLISAQWLRAETQTMQNQTDDAQGKLLESWQSYQDKASLMMEQVTLAPKNMLRKGLGAYDGIAFLQLVNFMDDDIFLVFATYGTDTAFTSRGTARLEVLFSEMLDCSGESRERGMQAVLAKQNGSTILYGTDSRGWLLYSYKIRRADGTVAGIHYVFPLSLLSDYFTIAASDRYYEVLMADGSSAVLGRQENGKTGLISKAVWEEKYTNGKFKILEGAAEGQGIGVRLYYDRSRFPEDRWVNSVQTLNIVLLLTAITLSALLSLSIAYKRLRELSHLVDTAQGKESRSFSEKNAYYSLQKLIMQRIYDNRRLEESVTQSREKMQEQVAHMVLSGLFWTPESLTLAFQELGFPGCWSRFFAGAVSVSAASRSRTVSNPLPGRCIWAPILRGEEKRYFLFLHPLEREDSNQLERAAVAEEIRKCLEEQGFRRVSIGISRPFNNSMLIPYACEGAVRMMERIVSGKHKDYYAVQDSEKYQSDGVLPDAKLFDGLDKALQDGNYEEAVRYFQKLLYESECGERSPQNGLYIKYVILAHIVSFLQTGKENRRAEMEILLEECVNLDPRKEREFTETVTGILQRALSERQDGRFEKILRYIDQNYQRPDLSYEEAAEAGNVSKTYLSRLFRTNFDMSYIEYLTRLRLGKACILLRTTEKNIGEVAELVGYASAANFRRAFRARYGISASDYRKKEMKGREENAPSEEEST